MARKIELAIRAIHQGYAEGKRDKRLRPVHTLSEAWQVERDPSGLAAQPPEADGDRGQEREHHHRAPKERRDGPERSWQFIHSRVIPSGAYLRPRPIFKSSVVIAPRP
jgi:hypothetical protein